MRVSFEEGQDAVRSYARGELVYERLHAVLIRCDEPVLRELIVDLATESLWSYCEAERIIRRSKSASKNDGYLSCSPAAVRGGGI